MSRYAIIEDGAVINIAVADTEFAAEQGWIEAPDNVEIGCGWDGENFTPPPGPSLAEAIATKWAAVKAIREAGKASGVEVPGIGLVETDPTSIVLINGAVSMAMIAQMSGQPFNLNWTIADNTEVPVDGPMMIGIGVAAGTHVGNWHGWGQALRPLIEGATTLEELDTIDITQGHPS